MIIFLADGGLGNQIFQYVFLKTIQKNNEKIIVSGFEDLKEVFEIDDIINLNKKNKLIRAFLFRVCKPILYFLGDKRILSSISVNHEKVLDTYKRESTTYAETKALLSFMSFVRLGFFQSEMFFDKGIVEKLKLKDIYLEKANFFLKDTHHINKVAIHIRRGDYKEFTVYGKSTLLPMNYFEEQIDWFLKNRDNAFFVFLSDDPKFVEKEFSHIENKIISSNNHFGTDLAIMTLCDNAILSPSSFGWWGTYLMQNRDIIFTPKYWLGFNSKEEYHKNSNLSFSEEIVI